MTMTIPIHTYLYKTIHDHAYPYIHDKTKYTCQYMTKHDPTSPHMSKELNVTRSVRYFPKKKHLLTIILFIKVGFILTLSSKIIIFFVWMAAAPKGGLEFFQNSQILMPAGVTSKSYSCDPFF